MSDNIKVVVKVRPLISREIEDKLTYQWRVKNDTLYQIDQSGRDLGTCFTFDKVYDKDTDTSEVYNDVAKPIVEAAITGFNGTIFAYGQTSSGKTYTMSGTDDSPGIIPQAIIHLFDRIKETPERDFLVRVSYIEIYNETLRDLLNIEKKNVKVHETLQGVKVDVDERVTSSPEEVLEAMREGESNRQTGATNMNEESSRSHSIFQITIASREHMEDEEEVGCVNVSQLNLVDLAGSERSGQTGATGIRFKEGTHINKSLSVLARVIKQLSDIGPNVNKYINYRDSKLTRILQNSLGGNAKTSIICAITPASVEETISTLQFANRAKAIQNKPEVNAVATNATTNTAMIQSLTKQLSKLQAQLEDKRNLEQDNANLQNKISNLQKWILNGFVHNSSMDSTTQSRRKLQQMRRVTISTLHPITEAEDSPTVPKFCTPSLKYNPLSISASSEFLPIQNASKTSLGPVPEETERMITPPPNGGQRAGEGDIINVDESDDISSEMKTCSPYHKCYAQSRTPPCVLRNNALAAEKSLQEIIDLTKREKMYTPNTVEMMEKLEQNCMTITKLEEELATLKEQNKEKDTEISELKDKVAKTEEEVKTIANDKLALENQCKAFSVKLTDWEVSYETLQNKYRRREEELLFLLDEEKSSKKSEDIRKSVSKELNFMDMSKDISLVNSDAEISIITSPVETESSEQIQELVMELQNQLSSKNDAISTLESNLYAEKQRIESLESSVHDLQAVIDDFNTKYPRLETENAYLQSTIETLNSTIENQKLCLEATNNDIQSYNSTIQELQIKLSRKETLPNIKINDNQLETMIINEEKFIANNENMKNIIKSFKLVLDSRNKEIECLKTEMKDNLKTKSQVDIFRNDIEIKDKHINTLVEQTEKLKDQLNENVDIINRLMANEKELSTKLVGTQDQNDILRKQNEESSLQASSLQDKIDKLTGVVQELNNKLDDSQNKLQKQSEEALMQARDLDEANIKLNGVIDKNDLLKKQNEQLVVNSNHLEDLNVKLKNTIAEKDVIEQEIKTKHSILSQEYENLTQKLNDLESEVNINREEMKKFSDFYKNTEEYLMKFKLVLNKLQNTLSLLNNKTWVVPEHVDSLETVFIVLDDGVQNLQTAAKQLLEELNQAIENNKITVQELSVQKEKYEDVISSFNDEIELLKKREDQTVELNEKLLLQINSLESSLIEVQNEMKTKNHDVVVLESQLNEIRENNENLRNDHLSKENASEEYIDALKAEIKSLSSADEKVKNELTQNIADLTRLIQEKQEEFADILRIKDEAISQLKGTLVETEKALDAKNQELADEEVKNDLQQKIGDLTRVMQVTEEEYEKKLKIKDEAIFTLESKLVQVEKELDMKQQELADEKVKNDLQQKIINLTKVIQETEEEYKKILILKDEAIFTLESKLVEVAKELDMKHQEVTTVMHEVDKAKENKITLLADLHNKVANLLRDLSIEYDLPTKSDDEGDNVYKEIIFALEKLSACIYDMKHANEFVYQTNDVKNESTQARKDIAELTEMRTHDMHELAAINGKSQEILSETHSMEVLNESLWGTSELLNNLKSELEAKSNEILKMEKKTVQWKDSFMEIQSSMQQQILQLQLENEKLRSLEGTAEHIEKKSPPSLTTICCGHIIEAMQMNKQFYSVSSTTSKSSLDSQDAQAQVNSCECADMSPKLSIMMEDNIKLIETVKQLESVNEALLSEQEEIRREIQLLVEPAQQLQKKVVNHRTNLSTLMATTYTENKLLQSQLKVMRHHHTRYINLCQKDIPYFKAQLLELMMMLKDNESYVDRHNVSFKRYSLPDVLDSNPKLTNFKNESTLDGDLLMMDTNITLASAESTLLSCDQTCLDNTQMNLDDDLAETSKAIDLYTQSEWLKDYDKKILETVQNLKLENQKLKEQVSTCSLNSNRSFQQVESQPSSETTFNTCSLESPSKTSTDFKACQICLKKLQNEENSRSYRERLSEVINNLEQDLENMRLQKDVIEKKYSKLSLEIPTTDTLVKKITSLEEENQKKLQQITKFTNDLSKKNEIIKELQEENDQLSTQVMESISEVDDLKKELDLMNELISKYKEIEADQINSKHPETEVETQANISDSLLKLDRSLNKSLSDPEKTSRLSKTCTQQSEIKERNEYYKTEDVITVKNSLDQSNFNMSIDLDNSISEKIIFSFTKDNPKEASKVKTSEMEQTSVDLYTVDKMECLKYYVEKTGEEKENLSSDFKVIDVMKLFYNNLVSKHGEEVENLLNKLRDFEDSKIQLKAQIKNLSEECEKLTKEIYVKDNHTKTVNEVLTNIRTNTDLIREQMCYVEDEDNHKNILTMFNDNLLTVLDKEFNISSCNIFESLIKNTARKHQKDLEDMINRYTAIQAHVVNLEAEVCTVNENLIQMKAQLTEKEHENDLLKAQKEKIHEISNAVTLDIVKKEQEIHNLIKTGYEQLMECNAIVEIDLALPVDASINLLFQKVKELEKQKRCRIENEKEHLTADSNKLKDALEQKELELASLKNTLSEKEEELSTQISKNEDFANTYQKNMREIYVPLKQFERTTEEKMKELINKISEKNQAIVLLQNRIKQMNVDEKPKNTDTLHKIEELIKENNNLKSINTMITKEKNQFDVELQKSKELINKNKIELDQLTADILVLRETVADNVSVIESLTNEAKALHEQNQLLKKKAEEKSQECSRLEMNIKTHEKTTEIQTRMISRLKKQQEDLDKAVTDKDKQLDELTLKCLGLQKDYEVVSQSIEASKEEVERLKMDKKHLEERVLQLETQVDEGHKRRSIEAIGEHARRRRQSLHDSRRLTDCDKLDFADHKKMEAVFESRAKPDDLFMDVDGDSGHSNRSTPIRLSRGRDSAVKQDSDDDPPSRPSSVLATKRRRQSLHDMHRNALSHTPSPHDHPRIVETETNNNADTVCMNIEDRLASTQKELEELKEKYRELDEECEICAQYLHERDAQCAALKKEKRELEQQVAELNARLKTSPNASQGDIKLRFSDASVNTDKDWANLHSVVVDRMSFDAEVEKNKRLSRTIEELRYRNQDLKKTVHKLMDKHSSTKDSRELELTKSELNACKEELEELKEKYRELDEECETCAEYLKERDEQCLKLKEAKAALEAKLLEYEEKDLSNIAQSVKKRRQSMHDQNRTTTTDGTDATTENNEEMWSYQAERNSNSRNETPDTVQAWEIKYKQVRHALDKVIMEKTALEHKLMAFHPTTYVATGSAIVQSQQLTDVMKENQKLKRINAKLVEICKKRGKSQESGSRDNRENEDPAQRD